MADIPMHPAAPHHLPWFIAAPGATDPLMVGSVIFLIVLLLSLGSMYFWLHSIPERIAHGSGRIQFQLVAVLSLIALFTHNNLFWISALLIALIPVPDFWTPLASMADSLSRMVRRERKPDLPPETTGVQATEAGSALKPAGEALTEPATGSLPASVEYPRP